MTKEHFDPDRNVPFEAWGYYYADMKTIKLDVDYMENSNALDLYLKTSFETEAAFGYFRKRL